MLASPEWCRLGLHVQFDGCALDHCNDDLFDYARHFQRLSEKGCSPSQLGSSYFFLNRKSLQKLPVPSTVNAEKNASQKSSQLQHKAQIPKTKSVCGLLGIHFWEYSARKCCPQAISTSETHFCSFSGLAIVSLLVESTIHTQYPYQQWTLFYFGTRHWI